MSLKLDAILTAKSESNLMGRAPHPRPLLGELDLGKEGKGEGEAQSEANSSLDVLHYCQTASRRRHTRQHSKPIRQYAAEQCQEAVTMWRMQPVDSLANARLLILTEFQRLIVTVLTSSVCRCYD